MDLFTLLYTVATELFIVLITLTAILSILRMTGFGQDTLENRKFSNSSLMSVICHEQPPFTGQKSFSNSQIQQHTAEPRASHLTGTRPNSSNASPTSELSTLTLNQRSSSEQPTSSTNWVQSTQKSKSFRRQKNKAAKRKNKPLLPNRSLPVPSAPTSDLTAAEKLPANVSKSSISEPTDSPSDQRVLETASDIATSNPVELESKTSTAIESPKTEPQSEIPEHVESASSKSANKNAKTRSNLQSTPTQLHSVSSENASSQLNSVDSGKEIVAESGKQNETIPTENRVVDPEAREKCNTLKKNVGIVLDKPRSPSLAILDTRVATFKNWPISSGQNPNILAEAGFFYKQTDDLVECFHCSVLISDWLPKLDPWVVHVNKYSFCAHVRQCKGDLFIFKILGDDENVSDTDDDDAKIEFAIERNKDAIEAAQSIFSFDDAQIREAIKIIIKDDVKQKFSGTDLVNAIEDIEKETEIKSRQPRPLEIPILQPTSLPATPKSEEEALIVEDLQAENERLKIPMMCKVCFNGEACIITLPCGHMATCPQCVSALKDCPMCRGNVKGTVRAFFSSLK